jgi:hypothetical protein
MNLTRILIVFILSIFVASQIGSLSKLGVLTLLGCLIPKIPCAFLAKFYSFIHCQRNHSFQREQNVNHTK